MLSRLDFLGPQINLTIKNNQIYKTNFGGFSSLLLIVIAFTAFLGFGRDMYEKKNPNVTFNRIVTSGQNLSKTIKDDNFLLAIYDQYSDLPFPDYERRFFIYYDYFYNEGNGTSFTSPKIPLKKCKKEALSIWEGYFYVDPSLYYCFPDNSNIDLLGVMNQGRHSSIRIQVDFCENNLYIKDCIPKEDSQELISTGRIQMHYIIENTVIDSLNYTQPGSQAPYTNIVNTSPFSWTRLNILFKQINSITDTGFFVENFESELFIAIESVNYESTYSSGTNTIFSHMLGNSKYVETYSRRYIKIQDIFAMMGGFLNASMIILKFFVQ
jgi:hypothetical protein